MPDPTGVPTVGTSYQLTVPEEALAPNVITPGPQFASGVVTVIVGMVLTVAIIAVLDDVVQPLSFAST